MSSSRDFLAATVADAALPLLRRPVEDLIYETLDARQVPSRTDFKELRDLVNNLRGQLVGATGGVRRLVEQSEGVDERLAALEESLDAAQQQLRSMAVAAHAVDDAAADADLDERLLRVEGRAEAMGEQLEALSAADRGPGEAALAELLGLREATEGELAGLRAAIDALRAELNAAEAHQRAAAAEQLSLTSQVEALGAAVGRLDRRLAALPAPLSEAALLEQVERALQASIPAVLDRMIARQVQAALATLAPAPAPAPAAPAPAPAAPVPAAEAPVAPSAPTEKAPGLCRVEGCDSPARARGFCQRHYQLWKRNRLEGFPNAGG